MSEAKRRLSYRPDIDAMRGIAVLAVFIYHLNEAWLPGGFTGVDVFFVISGYVVTGSVIGHSTETPWQQLSGFYLRRIRRILPNLLASVGVTSLGIALLVPPTETRGLFNSAVKALYGWSNNHFAAKATDYFGLDSNLNPLSHTWSLGVEEQFYLIFPLLLLLIGVSRRRAIPILLGLVIASLLLSLWWTREAPILAFFLMPSRFWELSAGSVLLLAQLQGFKAGSGKAWLRGIGYGLLLLALFKTSAQQGFPAPGALAAVLATLLLLQVGFEAASQRFLPWRWLERALVACGLLSYSLYLWHWPVLVFLRWTWGIDRAWLYLVAIGLSFGFAWLAYVLIEQPVRRKPLSAPWQWGLALMALVTTWNGIDTLGYKYKGKIFLGSSPEPVPENEKIFGRVENLPKGLKIHLGKCEANPTNMSLSTSDLPSLLDCRKAGTLKGELFLLGDSHAYHMLPAIENAAIKTGRALSFSNMQACLIAPGLTTTFIISGKPHVACERFSRLEQERAFQRLSEGDIVVISNWHYWELLGLRETAEGIKFNNRFSENGVVISRGEAIDLYIKSLRRLAKRLQTKGIRLVVFVDTPWLKELVIKCEVWSNARLDRADATYCSPEPSFFAENHKHLVNIISKATIGINGFYMFDPTKFFLSPSGNGLVMHRSKSGEILYLDQTHISNSASKRLAQPFLEFLINKGLVAANPR